MSRLAKHIVSKVFPDCKQAFFVGICPNCKRKTLIFWSPEDRLPVNHQGYVNGGFYCDVCKFGSAGKCDIELILDNR